MSTKKVLAEQENIDSNKIKNIEREKQMDKDAKRIQQIESEKKKTK